MKSLKFNKALFILIVVTAVMQDVSARPAGPLKKKFHWGNAPGHDSTASYAQAVSVGQVLYVSGTVLRDITPEWNIGVYAALEKTLQHFGTTFQHVVKENLYRTDIEAMKNTTMPGKFITKEISRLQPGYWSVYAGCQAGNRTGRPFT